MFLAIDPGISTGWALFDGRNLCVCGAGPNPPPYAKGYLQGLIIEKPQVYAARFSKGDPNNLITLAVQVGRYIERYPVDELRVVLPAEWKQQISKDAHHPRIYRHLSPAEQSVCASAGKGKSQKALGDMMDAIGLGQYAITMEWFK